MAIWTLGINDEAAESLEALRVTIRTISFSSQQEDEAVLVGYHAEAILNFQDWVEVFKDSVRVFCGVVTKITPNLQPNDESIEYRISGPWWFLEHLEYQSDIYSWKSTPAASGGPCPAGQVFHVNGSNGWGECFEVMHSTHVYLNINNEFPTGSTDVVRPTGWQMQEAVDWTEARFAGTPRITLDPLTSGVAGFNDIYIPSEEMRDITCSEVLKKMLRWSPDAVTWIDYTTTVPELHIDKRANLAVATIPIGAVEDSDNLVITPRDDIVPPKVVIKYEISHMIDSGVFTVLQTDAAPTLASSGVGSDEEFRAFRVTVDMIGSKSHTERAVMRTVAIPTASGATAATWWKTRIPSLRNHTMTDVTWGRSPTIEPDNGDIYELAEGSVQSWMGLRVQEITVSSTYNVSDSLNRATSQSQTVSARINVTNYNTANALMSFSRNQLDAWGEPVPTDLALRVYNGLKDVQYEGTISIVEDEVGLDLSIGKVLRITGADPAWGTMDALIQKVVLNPETGKTTVNFGFNVPLSPSDMMMLLRIQRYRNPTDWYSKYGEPSGWASSTVMNATPISDNTFGGGFDRRLVASTDVGHSDPVQCVILDPASGGTFGAATGGVPTIVMKNATGTGHLPPRLYMYGGTASGGTVDMKVADIEGKTVSFQWFHFLDADNSCVPMKCLMLMSTPEADVV